MKLFALSLLALASFSQTAVFPGAVVTDAQLGVATNNIQTLLSGSITSTSTSFNVVSATGMAANQIATIDSENVWICGVSGLTVSVGRSACPNVDGRGFDGSAAVSHSANGANCNVGTASGCVSEFVVAWHNNAKSKEIEATQGLLAAEFIYDLGYSSFGAACSAAVSAGKGVAITGVWTSASCGAPLWFPTGAGGMLNNTGAVTLSSYISAGEGQRIFEGSGVITFTGTLAHASVAWWGAVANGTGTGGTDQQAAFNTAALSLSASGGGALYIPWAPLCYAIGNTPVTVYSNTLVYSDAPGTCVQKLAGNNTGPVFEGGPSPGTAGVSNILFVNFAIDGNAGNITGISGDGYNQGISFNGCTGCGAKGMYVKNAYTGGISVTSAGASNNVIGNNVLILDTIITGSRRNNLEVLAGTGTVMRGGQLSNAGAGAGGHGSLSLGVDVEPFAAGQFVTGFQLDSVEISGNVDGGMSIVPAYDTSMMATLTNVNCHGNTGSYCLGAINYYAGAGVPTGILNIQGGTFNHQGASSVASMDVQGWSQVNITSVTTSNTYRGILVCGACSPGTGTGPVNIVASSLSGGTNDISTLTTVNLVDTTLLHGTIDNPKYVTTPMARNKLACNSGNLTGTDACNFSSIGSAVAVGAGTSSVVIQTTAVTTASNILLTFDPSLGGVLQVTCSAYTTPTPYVSARTAGVSFTVSSVPVGAGDGVCFSWAIVSQ